MIPSSVSSLVSPSLCCAAGAPPDVALVVVLGLLA